MKIIILEDQSIEAEHLRHELLNWSSQSNFDVELSKYRSGEDFFENCSSDNYDS